MNSIVLPLLVIVRLTILDAFRRRILWVLFFLTVVVVGLSGIGFERLAQIDVPAEGTDLAALAARYVSVTPLRLDRTDDEFSQALTATLK